jgi:regulator of RNase E activity RraB
MTTRADRYLHARRWIDGALALQRGVFDGVSLGLLDDDDLASVGDVYHATTSECRRRNHNHGGLFRWEEAVWAERFTATSRIAVLAAGAGREVIALARRGVAVDGYEPDPGLRRFGNDLLVELGLDATIADADPSTIPTFHHDYDGAIVGWGVYSLITPRSTRVAFLQELASRLPPHAPVLLSAMTRPGQHRYVEIVHRTSSALRRVRRQPATELGDTLQPNLTHLFALDELMAEVRAGGLNVVDADSGDYGWVVGSVPEPAIDLTEQERSNDRRNPDDAAGPHGPRHVAAGGR